MSTESSESQAGAGDEVALARNQARNSCSEENVGLGIRPDYVSMASRVFYKSLKFRQCNTNIQNLSQLILVSSGWRCKMQTTSVERTFLLLRKTAENKSQASPIPC